MMATPAFGARPTIAGASRRAVVKPPSTAKCPPAILGADLDSIAGRVTAGIVTLVVALGIVGLLVVEYGLLWHTLVAPWVWSFPGLLPWGPW